MVHLLGAPDDDCDERGCSSQGISYAYLVSGSFSVVARLNDPATRWSPYVFGGAAVYVTDPVRTDYLRPNHFGVQGGAGFEFRPATHTYFIELRYFGIPPGGVVPFVVGVRF
jgi:hypothetical protein